MSEKRPIKDGYQARPTPKLVTNGYQPTSSNAPSKPPKGGSGVKPKK